MFLKDKNIIFKIRRSKVTDYAALIKAMVCIGMVIFIKHERFFNIISIILVT